MTIVALSAGLTPDTAGTQGSPWFNTSNRATIVDVYEREFSIDASSMDWSGAYDGCQAGDSSQDLRQQTIRRVNFYRSMAGVPATVVENPQYSAKAQYGALMMSSEGTLSHHPDSSYACFSSIGAEAAANSNLYLGRSGPWAIDGYIEDPGDRNRDVGHRNTILHPPTTEMGVGHVAGSDDLHESNVLWVFDDDVFADAPKTREESGFVAWPPRGYVPEDIVHPRWSFGLGKANFDSAGVQMTVNGEDVPIHVVARLSKEGHVPSPIIVWETQDDFNEIYDKETDLAQDVKVSVTVANVIIDGAARDFSYEVTILGQEAAPGADSVSVNELAFVDERRAYLDPQVLIRAIMFPLPVPFTD